MVPQLNHGEDPPSIPDEARQDGRYGDTHDEARQAALEKELRGVRNINEVIEGVITTLETARGNMDTVSKTVDNASTLLNTWTRILSQTEHNQRLILNPDWKGATQDLVDIESDTIEKQQAAQRRAAEERRQAEARRIQEEADRNRQATATRGTRGKRQRGRAGHTRGSASSSGVNRSSSTRGGARGTGRYGNTNSSRGRGTDK